MCAGARHRRARLGHARRGHRRDRDRSRARADPQAARARRQPQPARGRDRDAAGARADAAPQHRGGAPRPTGTSRCATWATRSAGRPASRATSSASSGVLLREGDPDPGVPAAARGRGSVYEITGTRANVEMAVHVYAFLLATAERLWRENRGDARVRSGRDRLSYQSGVVRGFDEKLAVEREELRGTGLVWVGDADLESFLPRAPPAHRRAHPPRQWRRRPRRGPRRGPAASSFTAPSSRGHRAGRASSTADPRGDVRIAAARVERRGGATWRHTGTQRRAGSGCWRTRGASRITRPRTGTRRPPTSSSCSPPTTSARSTSRSTRPTSGGPPGAATTSAPATCAACRATAAPWRPSPRWVSRSARSR